MVKKGKKEIMFQVSSAFVVIDLQRSIIHEPFNFSLYIIFIWQVEFGKDFERNLSFLVDCRRAFGAMSQLKVVYLSGKLKHISSVENAPHCVCLIVYYTS